jgi:hypothetical protein
MKSKGHQIETDDQARYNAIFGVNLFILATYLPLSLWVLLKGSTR